MGVLNVTPDSFSDQGLYLDSEKAIGRGLEMVKDGADIVDVGGESTRPGADDVSVQEEIDRVIPVIEGILKAVNIPISIDTRKARVAEEAIKSGAVIVNDISGLRHDPAMASIIAKYGVAAILMHSKGTPKVMQHNPRYDDTVPEIIASLKESIEIAKRAGVAEDRIIIDPGIGFGKTVIHNLEILNRLDEFKAIGRPICIGTSRKSFIGKILGQNMPHDRLIGTIASSVIAIAKGARLIRVHDVKEMVDNLLLIL
jgi:dihydropteroate synthase